MKARQALLIVLLIALTLWTPSRLRSCGPFFPQAIFTYRESPGITLDRYIGGELGVIHPTYARRYLFVGYRYLSGLPLTQKEQKALLNPTQTGLSEAGEWKVARSKVPGVGTAPAIDVYRQIPGSQWEHYLNCPEDAFRAAANTLEQRFKTFGPDHPGVKSWVAAQDAVFSNCSKGETIPPPPEATLPPLLKADRAYQIAAAYFYAGNLEEAEKRFREIAADSSSPWSDISPYLVARTLIRKATLRAELGANPEVLEQAETQLRSVLNDGSRKQFQPAAARLLSFVELRLHPLQRLRELSQALLDPAKVQDLSQNIIDFEYLMRGNSGGSGETGSLAEWIVAFRGQDRAALPQALEKWRQTQALPWLVAAIAKIDPDSPEVPELVQVAEKVARDSPPYATVTYHRLRLLIGAGEKDRARRTLDALLPELHASLPRSSLNLFLAQRMSLAQNLQDFLQFAQRIPGGIADMGEWSAQPPSKAEVLFDADSVKVLNQGLPLAALQLAADSSALPVHLRRQVLIVAWTRSILLDNHQTAQALTRNLEQLYPALKPYLQEYLSATNPEAKRFAAAYLFLKFPGMKPYLNSGVGMRSQLDGIDDFRDNWWCSFHLDQDLDSPALFRYGSSRDDQVKKDVPPAFPEFLSDAERARFQQEWKQLFELDAAPNYLGEIVLSWARKNPADPRVPEALHLAVRSTRFGCTDKDSSRYSQDAFMLLHKNYPQSRWAELTKYWYK
jgi:hypothetical protein